MRSGVISSIAFFSAASSAGWMPFGAEGLHLPLLEIGFGDDVAVHLHEDLLDDLGGRTRRAQGHDDEDAREQPSSVLGHASDLQFFGNQYFTTYPRSSANRPPTRVKTPARASRVFILRLENLGFGETGVTSPAVARAVHQDAGAAATRTGRFPTPTSFRRSASAAPFAPDAPVAPAAPVAACAGRAGRPDFRSSRRPAGGPASRRPAAGRS